jgi:hypothetical protein
MTLKTQGVQAYLLDDTDAGNEVAKIDKVTSITGVGGSAGTIDVTHFDSNAKEYLTGLKDSGTISLGLNYDPNSESHSALLGLVGGDNKRFVICGPEATTAPTFSNGTFTIPTDRTTIDFTAGVQSMQLDLNTDDAWRISSSLQVSGDYVITPAV